MELLLHIAILVLLACVGIKILKVVAWVVGILILANILSLSCGLLATVIILIFCLLRNKRITDNFVIFICLALLIGVLF